MIKYFEAFTEIGAFRSAFEKTGGSQGSRVYSTDGTAVTQCSSQGGMGGKTVLYFIDSNPPPNFTENARCITTRQDSGISNHKGEHSAVFVEDRPRTLF